VAGHVAIIQARMTSTRLPGKILMDLEGRPMLAQQLRRVRRSSMIDKIVVATTSNATDDPVEELARAEGVGCFRGSEHDVLLRFVGAARMAGAAVVVRLTADCPLVDPEVIDSVVRELVGHGCDYASNVIERTWPRGLDVEAMHRDVLERVHRLGISSGAREHVTPFIYSERPDLFLRRSVRQDADHSALRWTVDTPVDLEVVRALYRGLDLGRRDVPYGETVRFAFAHPELTSMNQDIQTWQPPH
jgi:spore coat polysaccharide biosynthesis protein SpsF